jgi:hypothetical protein
MDWLDRMNSAMEYVETHLSEAIDYDQVASQRADHLPRHSGAQ